MQVMVKLYGTLGNHVPGYVHSKGILVEIPDNGKVKDLLFALNIPESQNVAIAMDGRVLARDDQLHDNAYVNVMQPLHGG
jgi:sulfur carrier protein ThiS